MGRAAFAVMLEEVDVDEECDECERHQGQPTGHVAGGGVHRGPPRSQVLDDIKGSGFWPRFFVSEGSPPLDVPHWHDCDAHVYLMEGVTRFLDVEAGEQLDVAAGDKVEIPARTVHAEGEVKARVVYLIAIPEPVTEDELLPKLSPDDL